MSLALYLYLFYFFMFTDGMTAVKGNTPAMGKHRKVGTYQIESRPIGVEVFCGHIKTTFIYTTDDLVRGGANIMVEVCRQGE